MAKTLMYVCMSLLLAACSAVPYEAYEGDPDATKTAETQYSSCLTQSAARLDDGRAELTAIGNVIATSCHPQYVQIQLADGDAAREEFDRDHAPGAAAMMSLQDTAEQARQAKEAVLTHRRAVAELASNGPHPAGTISTTN